MTTPMLDSMLGATVKTRSFADRVRGATFRDQHGRKWSTQIDKDTGVPTVPLTPTDWRAPFPALFAPAHVMTFPTGELGLMVIDYDRWITSNVDAWRAYQDERLFWARKEYGAAAMQVLEDGGSPKLRELAGPPPASTEFLKAMKAGNKWALGIRRDDGTAYPVPAWAQPYLETLTIHETYDGSGVDVTARPEDYPDVEDDGVVERWQGRDVYADVEEEVDPAASPDFEPMTRRRGRPPKGH